VCVCVCVCESGLVSLSVGQCDARDSTRLSAVRPYLAVFQGKSDTKDIVWLSGQSDAERLHLCQACQ
jgi:hypothetical protein